MPTPLARRRGDQGRRVGCHRHPARLDTMNDHRRSLAERYRAGLSELPLTLPGERIVGEILTLPISAGHTAAEVDEVVAAVREFFDAR